MRKYLKYLFVLIAVILVSFGCAAVTQARSYTEGVDDADLQGFYKSYILNGRQVVYNSEMQMYVFRIIIFIQTDSDFVKQRGTYLEFRINLRQSLYIK